MTLIEKLNTRPFFIIAVTCAVLFRCLFEVEFPQLDSDYAVQTEAAKNFVNGHGLSQSFVNPADLSGTAYKPLGMWPVGYALVLLPLYYMSGNFITAIIISQCLTAILLILSFVKIMRVLNVNYITQGIFFIFLGFTPTPFSYLGTTDTLTAALFIFSSAMAIELIYEKKRMVRRIIYISLLLSISSALRFACIPNAVIIPLFIAVYALISKRIRLFYPATFILLLSYMFIFIFYSIFKIDNSRVSFIDNLIHLKLYFNHLKWFDSFPIKALFFPRPLEYRLHDPLVIRYTRILILMASCLFTAFIFDFFLFRKKIFKNTFSDTVHADQKKAMAFICTSISCLVICSFISVQSLTIPPEDNSFGPPWMPLIWTFVYSTRYFVIPLFLILLLFILILNECFTPLSFFKKAGFFSFGILLVAFLMALVQWIYTNKQFISGNGGGSFWKNETGELFTFNTLNAAAKDNNKPVVYAAYNRSEIDGGSIAVYSKADVCRNYKLAIDNQFAHVKPLTLFLLAPPLQKQTDAEKQLLQKYSAEKISELNKGILYRINLL